MKKISVESEKIIAEISKRRRLAIEVLAKQ